MQQLVATSGLKVTPGILTISRPSAASTCWATTCVFGDSFQLCVLSLRGLNRAPEWFYSRYDTTQNFTWAFAGFNCLLSSFWPDGRPTEQARCEVCIGDLATYSPLDA